MIKITTMLLQGNYYENIFCELYKLLSKKIFIICLVVALCINAFTLIYSSAENYNDRTKHNNIEYYNSLIKNCNSSKKQVNI